MVPWRELRYFFFGHFLGRRGSCDRLAVDEGLEPQEWLCSMFSQSKGGGSELTETHLLTSDPLPFSLAIFQTTSRM